MGYSPFVSFCLSQLPLLYLWSSLYFVSVYFGHHVFLFPCGETCFTVTEWFVLQTLQPTTSQQLLDSIIIFEFCSSFSLYFLCSIKLSVITSDTMDDLLPLLSVCCLVSRAFNCQFSAPALSFLVFLFFFLRLFFLVLSFSLSPPLSLRRK